MLNKDDYPRQNYSTSPSQPGWQGIRMIEQMSAATQLTDVTTEGHGNEPQSVGELLRSLRGERTLRQVERDTGIANSYLSHLEQNHRNPGAKTLARLAVYYAIPMQKLFEAVGLEVKDLPSIRESSDIQRGYNYVLADPGLNHFPKPSEPPTPEVQQFIVQIYQHYTGKKLL